MSETMRQVQTGQASPLVGRVARAAHVQSVINAIRRGERRVDVRGLRGSSPAFVIEAVRTATRRPVIVCCPDGEAAYDACSDLRTVSGGSVAYFPEKDIFPQPYELKENLTVRGRRSAVLDRVLAGKADIVVTSLPGFLERTITPQVLGDNMRELAVGGRIGFEDLASYLVEVGYERVNVIEELGQFAVRGSIVDVFDPSWENPARLEFLEDEIDSIRSFDIDSQRSLSRLDTVRLLPATTVLVEESTLQSLVRHLTDRNFDKDTIAEIHSEIEHHRFSYLLRRYAPAMGVTASLLDFYNEAPLVFFWDEEGIGRAVHKLEADYDRVQRLIDAEYPLLELGDYIVTPETYTGYEVAHVHVWGLAPAAKGDTTFVAEKKRAFASRKTTTAHQVAIDNDVLDVGGDAPEVPEHAAPSIPADAIPFQTLQHPTVLNKLDALLQTIRKLSKKNIEMHVFSESAVQRERLADMLDEEEHLVHLPVGWMTSGFIWEAAGLAVLTDHEIFHRNLPRPSDKRKTRRAQGYKHDRLQVGDFVVHVDYGIGRYIGLEKVTVDGGEKECLSLRYLGNDRIFVPLDQMPLVEKYIGKEGTVPQLDKLGSGKWQRAKTRTKKALEDVAKEMLDAFAKREVVRGHAFKEDSQWQKELEASFPFEETPDQLSSTTDVKEDMETGRPMDRLICGDVGFGKTEVAIRAAFKAMSEGKQVAVLVPTTILALQHFRTFQDRMGGFPMRIEMLSRFKSTAQQKDIVADLKTGKVDLVIGTHRLLSKDIAFSDLGLLIVDEEHRFGVRSKEKLKQIKTSVDVLSMTATPIPRTLYMAVSGLKPISVIGTPPRNRHPVKTEVLPFDEDVIVQAISSERARDGQVFFVHNRVASIYSMQAFLERLIPELRVGVGHGQMAEKELESVILGFLDGEYDVLLCTTIIESGLDFPNVNTIIINRADRFGLAELYQLRGRVGRRERQAFCHLLVPRNFSITHTASKRLQAMEEFDELGSGYRLAMRDLEIRGAGNVLGLQQHGQMVTVGFDLYCKMLRQAVEGLQGQLEEEAPPCKVESPLASFVPERYVDDQDERMSLYRRLAAMQSIDDVDQLEEEMVDRFGDAPREAINLLELTRIKLLGVAIGTASVRLRSDTIRVEFLPGRALAPEVCAGLVETFEGRVLFKSGESFGLTLARSGGHLIADARRLLTQAGKTVRR